MDRRRVLDLVALLVAVLLSAPVLVYASSLEAKLLAEWGIFAFVVAIRAVPRIVKGEWAAGVSDPEDPARIAFVGAVDAEVIPKVQKIVDGAVTALRAEFNLTAVRADVEAVRAQVAPLAQLVEDLKPLLLTVDAKDNEGKPVKVNALLAQLLELADWSQKVEAPLQSLPSKESLDALPKNIENAVEAGTKRALTADFAHDYEQVKLQMRQDTMKKKAAEIAQEFATEAAFVAQNPQLVAQGQRLEKIDKALGDWMVKHHYPESYKALVQEFLYPMLAQGGGGGGPGPQGPANPSGLRPI